MKIQSGIPKTIVAACERVNKKYPGAVTEIWAEDNDPSTGPDYWVGLEPGFCNPVDGVHTVHEFSRKSTIDKVASIAPGNCEDCVKTRATRSFPLTAEDREEVLHKIYILIENEDACLSGGDETPLTSQQREEIENALQQTQKQRADKVVFTVPGWAVRTVCEEMKDHVQILRACSDAARDGSDVGQALRIAKQAKRLERLFAL